MALKYFLFVLVFHVTTGITMMLNTYLANSILRGYSSPPFSSLLFSTLLVFFPPFSSLLSPMYSCLIQIYVVTVSSSLISALLYYFTLNPFPLLSTPLHFLQVFFKFMSLQPSLLSYQLFSTPLLSFPLCIRLQILFSIVAFALTTVKML